MKLDIDKGRYFEHVREDFYYNNSVFQQFNITCIYLIRNTSCVCKQAYIRGAYYGTTYRAIEDTQSNEKICIIDIDTQGVQNIKASDLACKYLFISPPSIEALGTIPCYACATTYISIS